MNIQNIQRDLDLLKKKPATGKKVLAICREALEGTGVTLEDVLGHSRHKNVVIARHALMALVREETNLSYPQIGEIFNRDHTTIIAAVKKYA